MKNLKCPYCDKKISYYMGYLERKQGEHSCNKCGKNSTIYYKPVMKIIALLTILISVTIFIIWFLNYSHNYINGVIAMIIPFIIFIFISPIFINFIPLKIHNKFLDEKENKVTDNNDTEENNTTYSNILDTEDEFVDINSI